MEDKIFRQDAKSMVDAAFDSRLFRDEVTRDDMNKFEDLICFLLQSRFESYKKIEALMPHVKSLKSTNKSN